MGDWSRKVLLVIFYVLLTPYGEASQRQPASDQVSAGGRNYTVYRWPQNVQPRNYNQLKREMLKYSGRVGTVYHRVPIGPGEIAWVDDDVGGGMGLKSQRFDQLLRLLSTQPSAQTFCNKVVQLNVNSYVPPGSQFLQYGNCGEGADVGVCLASKFGFSPEREIRICNNQISDHSFAMVKHPTNKWCILDRWNIIGNFTCGVDYIPSMKTISLNNQVVQHDWFRYVKCSSFQSYLDSNGDSVWW